MQFKAVLRNITVLLPITNNLLVAFAIAKPNKAVCSAFASLITYFQHFFFFIQVFD